jgi:hypothetical protein
VRAEEGAAAGVDEVERPLGQHVLLQPVRQPDALPDPDGLLVRGDRPRPGEDLRVALQYDGLEAHRAQQVRRGDARGPVPDHRDVVRVGLGSVPSVPGGFLGFDLGIVLAHQATSLSPSALVVAFTTIGILATLIWMPETVQASARQEGM